MSDFAVFCLTFLVAGLGSPTILIWAYSKQSTADKERQRDAVDDLETALQRLRVNFCRRRWKRLPGDFLRLWRAYSAWKRLSWIGRLDLALIYGLSGIGVAIVTPDIWGFLKTVWEDLWPFIQTWLADRRG